MQFPSQARNEVSRPHIGSREVYWRSIFRYDLLICGVEWRYSSENPVAWTARQTRGMWGLSWKC
jgi:hypothetical protein